MPTKKKNAKKISDLEKGLEKGIDEAKKIGRKIMAEAKRVKGKYDKLDEQQKRKILAGIAGAAAIVGVALAGKRKKK